MVLFLVFGIVVLALLLMPEVFAGLGQPSSHPRFDSAVDL